METMAGTAMDAQVLVILGSAFGVMFATLTTLLVTSIRLQHRDSLQTRIETRELITQSGNDNRKLIEQATARNSKLIEQATTKLTADFKEDTRVTQGKLDKVVTSLSDARERLARIEGHLGIGLPSQADPESNGDTTEAA